MAPILNPEALIPLAGLRFREVRYSTTKTGDMDHIAISVEHDATSIEVVALARAAKAAWGDVPLLSVVRREGPSSSSYSDAWATDMRARAAKVGRTLADVMQLPADAVADLLGRVRSDEAA